MTTAIFGHHNGGGFFDRIYNTGASQCSRYLQEIINDAVDHFEKPLTLQPKERALKTLGEICTTCSNIGWDGYGALPISKEAHEEAARFLKCLPLDLPIPEIVPDPRGGVSFEWYKSKNWVFTVSTKGENLLIYAGLMGENNRIYGTHTFYDSIPKIVTENIRRLVP